MKRIALFILCSVAAFGANAAPVAVSSLAVSGSSVTVTTSLAHGVAVNQGVCLSSPTSACGVVTAVNGATVYVFSSGSTIVSACASACGTSFPAPRLAVLNQTVPDQGHFVINYVLWLTTQQPCPGPSFSSWKPANGSVGASTAQVKSISDGLFVEKSKSQVFPANAATTDLTTFLQNDYAMEQQALSQSIQPCQYYGQVFDGAGWAKQ